MLPFPVEFFTFLSIVLFLLFALFYNLFYNLTIQYFDVVRQPYAGWD